MSDIKQASAMLAMAHRDLKALGGMHDAGVFADEILVSMCSKPLKKA